MGVNSLQDQRVDMDDYGDYGHYGNYDYGEPEHSEDSEEEYPDYEYSNNGINCNDGVIIPLWSGTDNLSISDRIGRGVIYFCILLYLLLGVAIYMNKMMESIETMTSLMKKSSVPDPDTGESKVVIVKIWNQAAANMFMVLASSSPVICISIADIFAKGFRAGFLGPFTIMGTSAFNLFVVVGVAISAVPRGQVRKANNLLVLILLAVFTIILYTWAYCQVGVFSYGIVEVWEAFINIILFIVILLSTTLVTAMVGRPSSHVAALAEYKANYELYKQVVLKIGRECPGISDNDLQQKVAESGVCRRPKSWAYYLTQATDIIAGSWVPHKVVEEGSKDENNIEMDANSTESVENLKCKVDSIILRANSVGSCKGSLWLQQFQNLVNLQHLGGSSPGNCIIHILTVPWKLLAALIPPASMMGGFLSLVMCSVAIFKLSCFIADIAGHLGCFTMCVDNLTGFILISIFLNIPNLIAAKTAAAEEDTADLSLVCLLTGNCFMTSLGLGLPWLAATVYWETQGLHFEVPVGSFGYCVAIFLFLAMIAFIILFTRRCCAGGELGGNLVCKIITTVVFFIFWVTMILQVFLEAYDIIEPGL